MATFAQQQRRLVEQHRRAQLSNRASFLREFLALWDLLNVFDLDNALVTWLRAVLRLITAFRQTSADLAANHYREMRRLGVPDAQIDMPDIRFESTDLIGTNARVRRREGPSVPVQVRREALGLVQPGRQRGVVVKWGPSDRAAHVSARVTGPIAIKQRIAKGEKPEAAKRSALPEAMGAAGRHVLNGGRATTLALAHSDERAIGWIRVTDGDPCAFCAMLASRGVTWGPYAKTSFDEANEKFNGRKFESEHDDDPRVIKRGEVQVHDNCACGIAVVFRKDDPILEPGKQYRELWDTYIRGNYSNERRPGRESDAIRAWRRLIERPDVFKEKNPTPARRRKAA